MTLSSEINVELYRVQFNLTLNGPWESPITLLTGKQPWTRVQDIPENIDLCIKKWMPVVNMFPNNLKGRFAYILECESKVLNEESVPTVEHPYPEFWPKIEKLGFDIRNKGLIREYFQAMIACLKELAKHPDVEKKVPQLPLAKFGETPIRALELD